MVRLTTYCLLAVLVAPALNLPTPGYTEETRLIHSIGLGHLAHKFEASEVKIQHMAILVSGVVVEVWKTETLRASAFTSTTTTSPTPPL